MIHENDIILMVPQFTIGLLQLQSNAFFQTGNIARGKTTIDF